MSTLLSRFLLAGSMGAVACGGLQQTRCAASPPAQVAHVGFEPEAELSRSLGTLDGHPGPVAKNLSDAAITSDGSLLLVSDEGTSFFIVDPKQGRTRAIDLLRLLSGTALGATQPEEIDLEAVASFQSRFVLAGSASLKRQQPKSGKDNRERMGHVRPASGEGNAHSNYVYVLESASSELPSLTDHWDLRAMLLAEPLLQPFRELPSKDNGLDVEGIAADATHLYFGLRGPVLRGHALVVRTDWKGHAPTLYFLDLKGLGVRGLLRQSQGRGFYILAGPTMELDGPFTIYAWDGRDSAFAGCDSAGLVAVTHVKSTPDEKPEALFMWRKTLCTMSDGPTGGGPSCTKRQVRWPL